MPLPKFLQSTRKPLAAPPPGPPMAAAGAAGGAAAPQSLKFAIEKQQQTLWCWAAVSVSVARFFDKNTTWTQCQVAAKEKNAACCEDGGSSACNQTHALESALRRTGTLLDFIHRAYDFTEVVAEINRRAPLGCRVQWDVFTGHFVVIDGVSNANGTEQVDVKDPDPNFASATYLYDEFAYRYRGIGSWTHSYQTTRTSAGGGPMGMAPGRLTPRRKRRAATN